MARGYFPLSQVRHKGFNLLRNPATVSGTRELLNQEAHPVSQLLFDLLVRAAEKIPHGRPEQQFISKDRLQIRGLFEPLMARDARTAFGAEEERHLSLREARAFPMCADVVGASRGRHMIFSGG